METIVTKQLLTFLETNNLLADHQFGFRKARSTGDLLAHAVHVWSSALESNGESRVISLDISKAFDPFWHKGLPVKLPMFGLHHTLINWIGSFLSDRSIAVRVDGFLSNLHSINAGVPQGSVISPVLFILFINDPLTSTSSSIHSFADDTFLSSSFSFNPNDHASTDIQLHRNISASLLSNDLTFIEKWVKDNLVSFNQSKTKQAVLSRKRNQNFPAVFVNGDELDTSTTYTQLGLSLSSNIIWKTHIHSLAKHASQKLGFLARARGFFSPSHLLSIYKSQIRPSLECCSHVWGGAPKSTLCLHRQSPFQSHSSHQQSSHHQIAPTSFPSSFSWKSLHLLQILYSRLFSGDQGYYSSSSEACQDHQKLNSFTPFPSFTA